MKCRCLQINEKKNLFDDVYSLCLFFLCLDRMFPIFCEENFNDDDEDDQPFFRRRFRQENSTRQGHWEEFDRQTKSWRRLCDRCCEKVCSKSKKFCFQHRKIRDKVEKISMSISSSLFQPEKLDQIKTFVKKFSRHVRWTSNDQFDLIDETTTHLIVENPENLFVTTISKEVLSACLRHVFIGSISWILTSLEQSKLVDYFPFEILRWIHSRVDSRGIKQCRFDHLPLFPSSMIIDVQCRNGIEQFHLTREDLIEFVHLSGATLFDENFHQKPKFVLCNSLKEVRQHKKIHQDEELFFCKPEFFFHSIVQHEIQSVKTYLW